MVRSTKIRRKISARMQVVLFVFYAIHMQLKNSERQISLSDESSPSPRSGSAVDKARRTRHRLAWPSFHFLSAAVPSSLARCVVFFNSNTLPRKPSKISLSYNNEGHACYTERCLAFDSNHALNVMKMSMRCRRRLTPSPNVSFFSVPCNSSNNSCLRLARITIESLYITRRLFLLLFSLETQSLNYSYRY